MTDQVEGGSDGGARHRRSAQGAGVDSRHWQRAQWRSRRGMLELDLLLADFVRERYPQLDAADQAAYRRLLARDDWELVDWLQGQAPAPGLVRITRLIRAFNAAAAVR